MKDLLIQRDQYLGQESAELSLVSERNSARGLLLNTKTSSIIKKSQSASRKPKQKTIELIGDRASLLPSQNYGLFRWFVHKYGRFDILNPEKIGVLIWNIVNYFIILFYITEIGFLVGYGNQYWQAQLNYFYYGNIFFILFFLVDILISPLKAYYQNGILVQNRVIIIKRYMRFYLWLDILAFLGVLIPYVATDIFFNYFKILFAFKLVAAYELDSTLMMLIKSRFKKSHVYAIGRIVFLMILWSHWMGVGFFAVDHWVYRNNIYGPNTPNYCWIYNSALEHNISGAPWYIQYVYTLYYSVGNITTIAYGDITAYNPIDAGYVIIICTMSILLFTYFFKMLVEIIFLAQAQQFQNRKNVSLIRRYLRNNKVNSNLESKIKAYFESSWEEEKFRNRTIQMEYIERLPKQLREQLNISLFGHFIVELGVLTQPKDINHMANKTPYVTALSGAFVFERITAGQILYRQNEIFEQHQYVYYCDKSYGDLAITLGQGKIVYEAIKNNTLEKLTQHRINQIYLKAIKVTSMCGLFGQVSFFTKSKRDHWAICNDNIQIIKLARSRLDQIMIDFGSQLEKQRLFLTTQSWLKFGCYICKEQGHSFKRCPYASYQPSFEKILTMMTEKNKRDNNKKIQNIREIEKTRTAKFNSWRVYKKLNKQIDTFGMNFQKSSHYESEGDDQFREDFLDELMLLKTIIKEHWAQNQKSEGGRVHEDLDVDVFYTFKLYHPNNDINLEIKRCNSYLKSRSETKKQGRKNK